ncbi:MAG: MBL fold metallo-hydrolase [Rhodospirillaceae bacterium]
MSASLEFPWATAPAPGTTIEVVPGIHWLTTSLPFRLSSINLWLLEDGDGWCMVDCGFPIPEVRDQIEEVWATVLGGRPITRLIITHHHPDHVGNAPWICERWGIVPTMTPLEFDLGRWMLDETWREDADQSERFHRSHGLPEATLVGQSSTRAKYGSCFARLGPDFHRLQDGDSLNIGGRSWEVIEGLGHSDAQALLHCPESGVLISGDQVLPKISPNVSVYFNAPKAEPLSEFLDSNSRISARVAETVLVLPSHKQPFYGLHRRIAELEKHHRERLDGIEAALKDRPQTAFELLEVVFGAIELDGHQMNFAMGEAVAHLHHLEMQGRVKKSLDAGVWRFVS